MTKLPDIAELRLVLELSEHDRLEPLAEVPLARSDAELGFAADQLWERILSSPTCERIELGLKLRLSRWDRQAGVFHLELAENDSCRMLEGASREFASGSWWIDARAAGARALIELSSGGELVLLMHAEQIRVLALTRQLTCPPLAELCAGMELAPWLSEWFEQCARSPVRLDRLVAPGYVLRHARPRVMHLPFADLASQVRARKNRVRAWVGSLQASVRGELVDQALLLSEHLLNGLLELDQADELSGAELDGVVEHLCLERERLAAVCAVLETDAELLRRALVGADREAEQHFAQIAGAAVDHELLRAVGELEPDAWWGKP
ncbi:MAG TPA: hypothetical protein VFU02_14705 [Polyangiaceae bacterium]|nr:hypothetical protein [Polyangiaceae bacterium]